jgi:transposase
MLQVPRPEEEDRRQGSRESKTLTAERVRMVNRIKGLLFAQGVSGYPPTAPGSARQAGTALDR